jgi:ribA/ribD-fused uncharacterized protein
MSANEYSDENNNVNIIPFWRVTDPYGMLCQWYMVDIIFDRDTHKSLPKKIKSMKIFENKKLVKSLYNTYNCSEQFMMFGKAMVFNDKIIGDKILRSTSPKTHKSLGRKVSNFDADIWSSTSVEIVTLGNYLKFTQNNTLKNILSDTGDSILVEASPYDKLWGVGIKFDNKKIYDKTKWKGLNLLGEILMSVRDTITD